LRQEAGSAKLSGNSAKKPHEIVMNVIGTKLRTIWARNLAGRMHLLEGIIVSGKTIHVAAAGLLALGLATGFAFAAADDAIKGRQGCMKASGKMMGDLVPMFKGEKPYDKATVDAAIAAHDAACAGWADWWGPDTQKGETVETFAKPEIWTDPAGFTAAGDAFYAKFIAVKDSTDEASFKAAFPAMGQGCGGCHEKFRRPKG